MLHELKSIKFPRSMKPVDADNSIKPDLITFSDGNPDAFGTVAYSIWTLEDGSKEIKLIMSKAKLSPLQCKG